MEIEKALQVKLIQSTRPYVFLTNDYKDYHSSINHKPFIHQSLVSDTVQYMVVVRIQHSSAETTQANQITIQVY